MFAIIMNAISDADEVAAFAIDDIEDDPLVLVNVLHGEVEPEPVPRVAGVRSDVQIILELVYEIHSPEISGLEYRVKTKMPFLCFTRMSGRSHNNLLNIPQTSLVITVIRI